jgi:hypothetical protein
MQFLNHPPSQTNFLVLKLLEVELAINLQSKLTTRQSQILKTKLSNLKLLFKPSSSIFS